MTTQFAACLAFVLEQEGGFADNPHDPGGCTMHGVTLATYRDWLGNPSATVADLRAIAPASVSAIYGVRFWNPCRCDAIPPGLDLMAFDMAVNAGPVRSARMLQEVLGVDQDGSIGPQTLLAAKGCDVARTISALAGVQASYYRHCSGFTTFGKGWLARVDRRRAAAAAMVGAPASAAPAPVPVPPVSPPQPEADALMAAELQGGAA